MASPDRHRRRQVRDEYDAKMAAAAADRQNQLERHARRDNYSQCLRNLHRWLVTTRTDFESAGVENDDEWIAGTAKALQRWLDSVRENELDLEGAIERAPASLAERTSENYPLSIVIDIIHASLEKSNDELIAHLKELVERPETQRRISNNDLVERAVNELALSLPSTSLEKQLPPNPAAMPETFSLDDKPVTLRDYPNASETEGISIKPFDGGTIVFSSDRVDLCGVDICSGPRSESRRIVLELLAKTRHGRFISYSGAELEAAVKREGGKGTAAGCIRDLRTCITKQLLEKANINCGREDVIQSGCSGYRFSDQLSVQQLDFAETAPSTDDVGDGVSEIVSEMVVGDGVGDDLEVNPDMRRSWILKQLKHGLKLKSQHVVNEFKCNSRTAERDLEALKGRGQIEFFGSPRTGYYRLVAGEDRSS